MRLWMEKVRYAADWLISRGKYFLTEDEEGIGTVEIILILLVLLGLIFIFKEQLTELVGDLFEKIVRQSSTV